ncbi:MAG: DUF1186 domain-containing protein [Calothrix sp. C42_A2020_038]|nr:DUF1186 domain-containing protein [Calothrix sp. C42_A2020_038]
MANSTSYQPPVAQLLTLGQLTPKQQLNYILELGLGSEHIPDLIRMAVDNELLGTDGTANLAPVHAWRALGQLQASDAIVPLMQLFDYENNDLVNEELPKFYGIIGSESIPALTAYLNSEVERLFPRVTAINSLEEIANQHPDARNQVVTVLTHFLQLCKQNPGELNGFIISALMNLQAIESAHVIKYAFNAKQVSEDIVGNWNEVRESLGIASDEEVQEFQPELQQVAIKELEAPNINTEVSAPAVADKQEDVTTIEAQTIDSTAVTDELTLEITETETSAPAVADTKTQTTDDTVLRDELTSEFINVEATVDTANTSDTVVVELATDESISEVDTVVVEVSTDESTLEVDAEVAALLEIVEVEQVATEEVVKVNAPVNITAESEVTNITNETSTQFVVASDVNEQIEDTSNTFVPVVEEENKGFGRPTTTKEKAKGSKKKKRSFSDL